MTRYRQSSPTYRIRVARDSVTSLKNRDEENLRARQRVPAVPSDWQIPVKKAVPWKRGSGE